MMLFEKANRSHIRPRAKVLTIRVRGERVALFTLRFAGASPIESCGTSPIMEVVVVGKWERGLQHRGIARQFQD